jgi:hypothetical protein
MRIGSSWQTGFDQLFHAPVEFAMTGLLGFFHRRLTPFLHPVAVSIR